MTPVIALTFLCGLNVGFAIYAAFDGSWRVVAAHVALATLAAGFACA